MATPRKTPSLEDNEIVDVVEDEGQPLSKSIGAGATDQQLSTYYEATEFKIVQERNDFLLHQVLDFIDRRRWMNLTPEYQRRKRWDQVKKSLLIESLLMNLPVPPIFLYEVEPARYEVMDGQQRLNAIMEFYHNTLVLDGLETWAGLNGRTYKQCPPRIRRGIDRRKVAAVILTADTSTGLDPTEVRREVFERLNTGGEKLNAQELRNCLYAGSLNQLILKLSHLETFASAWGIPSYGKYEKNRPAVIEPRKSNKIFSSMADNQIVLRFLAFRNYSGLKGSVRSILDAFMRANQNLQPPDLAILEKRFTDCIEIVQSLFGENAFKLPDTQRRSVPLYDALMVAIDAEVTNAKKIRAAKKAIVLSLDRSLRRPKTYAILVGRPNTAAAIVERIDHVRRIIRRSIAK